MHILDHIEKLPDTNEGKIMRYLHTIFSTYPGISPKIHFNTPFYTRNKWLCYLSPQKKEGVELCFVQAVRFSKHLKHLNFKKRKQVAGITYFSVEEIDEVILDKLILEAIRIDDKMKKKKTN